MLAWLRDQPGYEDGEAPVGFISRAVLATVAGDDFAHRLVLVPGEGDCRSIRAVATRMPVIVTPPGFFGGVIGIEDYRTYRCFSGVRPLYREGSYSVYGPPATPGKGG